LIPLAQNFVVSEDIDVTIVFTTELIFGNANVLAKGMVATQQLKIPITPVNTRRQVIEYLLEQVQ
jgi:hypothetical protein